MTSRPAGVPSRSPIFVLGVQRSGTTLLQSILGAHSSIAAAPELHWWFRVAAHADEYGDLDNDEALVRAVDDTLDMELGLLDGFDLDRDRIVDRARGGDRTMAGVLAAVMEDFVHAEGANRWSEKSPGQPAALMRALFPHAQFLHIVRDPRDVVASALGTPWRSDGLFTIALGWVRYNLAVAKFGEEVGPDRYHRVRYEDLTRDPEAAARAVFEFLHEPFQPEVLTSGSRRDRIVPDVMRPWQGDVASRIAPRGDSTRPLQDWRVAAVTREVARRFGYDLPDGLRAFAGRVVNAVSVHRYRDAARTRRLQRRLRSSSAREAKQAFIDERVARVRRWHEDRAAD